MKMQLSARFLQLIEQQLKSFEVETGISQLVIYVAQNKDGDSPSLEVAGQWPPLEKTLPPVEEDSELRAPSPGRRWYPLQDGAILLGVLRAERSGDNQVWPKSLDQRLQATAAVLAQCLGLENDRTRLFQELNQQKEQIGMMVHQLRNPLAALRTYAQLLMRKLGPDSNHLNLVEGLLSEQEQLNRYLSALDEMSEKKLLLYEGISAPLLLPPVLSNQPELNLKSLLTPLIERASATANLQDRKWFPPKSWPEWTLKARPSKEGVIAEIVANLLENAFRYSPVSSDIGLFLSDTGICIWDTGPMIEEKIRDQIFLKGVRGNQHGEFQGSGLGLSLGRQLTEQLGGKLKLIIPPELFDNSLPASGNAFVLILPVKRLQT